jgi:outer membrane protein insertion porin family
MGLIRVRIKVLFVSFLITLLSFQGVVFSQDSTQKNEEISKTSDRDVIVRPAPKREETRPVTVRKPPEVKQSSAASQQTEAEARLNAEAQAVADADEAIEAAASPKIVEEEEIGKKTDGTVKDVLGPGVPAKRRAPDEGIAVEEGRAKNIVSDIEVRGNRIISSGTILNKIKIRRGDPLLQATINDDIKRLYASGFFQDIKVDIIQEAPDQFRVVFTVDEKPIVRQIIIEGNESISEGKLRKEIHLIEGQILDPKIIKEGEVAIRELYKNKGFKFVEVKSEVDMNEYSREAILYILIDEGQKFQIKKVNFEGNHAFSSKKLYGLMRTKSRFIILLRTGVFHEDHFQNDIEKIRSFYILNGYADVRIEPRFDYDREEKKMTITLMIEEGQIYTAGDIRIEGNVLFPESEIWEVLSMLPGDIYSQIALNDDLQAISRFYFYQGYITAQADPDIRFNRDTGKVDIVYHIQEGDLFFVNKVKVRGNTKTKDMVIRRELRVRPGEKFDGRAVDRSKERLESLGYFEEVEFETEEPEDATAPNVRDVIFKVKERQTGQLSFGGGISSVETLIGFAEISQNNFDLLNWPTFTGGGQSVFLRGRIGTKTRDLDFGFTEPYLFNRPWSYSMRLYDTYEKANNVDWNEERLGNSNDFGHQFTEYISGSIGITAERVWIKDVEDGADPQILENGDTNNLAKGRLGIVHDTRNNRLNPKRGHYFSATSEIVGGDSQYYSLFMSFAKYWTLFRTHILESRTRIGFSDSLPGTISVPVFDRYYAGGIGTVRGYGFRRVGPKGVNGNPIGGQGMLIQNIDYTFPIINNFKGVFFVDIGNVTADAFDIVSGDFVITTGPGIKINTPIGPMAFYYGYPISNADPEHSNGRFEFSIAKSF